MPETAQAHPSKQAETPEEMDLFSQFRPGHAAEKEEQANNAQADPDRKVRAVEDDEKVDFAQMLSDRMDAQIEAAKQVVSRQREKMSDKEEGALIMGLKEEADRFTSKIENKRLRGAWDSQRQRTTSESVPPQDDDDKDQPKPQPKPDEDKDEPKPQPKPSSSR